MVLGSRIFISLFTFSLILQLIGENKDRSKSNVIEDSLRHGSFCSVNDTTLLDPSDYHHPRAGLENSFIKFSKEKKGRVAFLGGSITFNPGWRDSVAAYLSQRFPETAFEFINAGIPSMGSTPAAFRLERDVLSKGSVDLLFEEAAVNDQTNNRSALEQVRGMEGIVRHARTANPLTDMVILYFVDPDKMVDYGKGNTPLVIQNHEKVARHYNISTIDLAREVTERIASKEFTWENDFIDLHPSPFGQGIYARSIIHFLEIAYSEAIKKNSIPKPHPMPRALDNQSYDKGYLVEAATIVSHNGWFVDENWKPDDSTGTRADYVNVPMLISESQGNELVFGFEGRAVGISVASGRDAGSISFKVDDEDWQVMDLFTKWSNTLHLPWYYTLATGLDNSRHRLYIRLNEEGKACRIRYFYVNGH